MPEGLDFNNLTIAGVLLFLMVAFLRGSFVTKREADSYEKRAEAAEANEARLQSQVNDLMEITWLVRATFEAAQQRNEGDGET